MPPRQHIPYCENKNLMGTAAMPPSTHILASVSLVAGPGTSSHICQASRMGTGLHGRYVWSGPVL